MGGLSRRATIIEQQREQSSVPVFVFEGGNFGWNQQSISDSRLAQQRVKTELQVTAMVTSGIDGIGLGQGELTLGIKWLVQLKEEVSAPFTLANLACSEKNPFATHTISKKEGKTIGFTSVLPAAEEIGQCTLNDPKSALQNIFSSAPKVDIWVVASQLSAQQLKDARSVLPKNTFVLESKRSRLLETPKKDSNDLLIFGSGSKGKHLGIVEVSLQEGREGFYDVGEKDQYQDKIARSNKRISSLEKKKKAETSDKKRNKIENNISFIKRTIEKAESQIAHLQANKNEMNAMRNVLIKLDSKVSDHAQISRLLEQYLVKIEEAAKTTIPSTYQGRFVGSEICMGCHAGPYAQWKTTGHAKAWKTLEQDNRSQDLACFSCHATGVFHPDGPKHPAALGNLINVGCESCHGPGREHVKKPTGGQMVASPDVNVCTQCHDGVKDEGRFDAESYFPKVKHDSSGN